MKDLKIKGFGLFMSNSIKVEFTKFDPSTGYWEWGNVLISSEEWIDPTKYLESLPISFHEAERRWGVTYWSETRLPDGSVVHGDMGHHSNKGKSSYSLISWDGGSLDDMRGVYQRHDGKNFRVPHPVWHKDVINDLAWSLNKHLLS